MSEFSAESGAHGESAMPHDQRHDRPKRRRWVAPSVTPHSTMTVLTQSPLPQPLSLLFLQSSIQCFNHSGTPVPCP
jgi:hypothetical protein